MNVALHGYPVSTPEDVRTALVAAKEQGVDAIYASYIGATVTAEAEIREFASANRLPDFWAIPPPVGRGGFMSYSPRLSDNARRGAALIDKILRGARVADLPFEYPTQYDLEINLKSANERGIAIPQSILLRATRVIE